MPARRRASDEMGESQLDVANVATYLILIFAVVGAILVILSAVTDVDPALRLTFGSYLDKMAIAAAGLAIGRGIKAAGNAGVLRR